MARVEAAKAARKAALTAKRVDLQPREAAKLRTEALASGTPVSQPHEAAITTVGPNSACCVSKNPQERYVRTGLDSTSIQDMRLQRSCKIRLIQILAPPPLATPRTKRTNAKPNVMICIRLKPKMHSRSRDRTHLCSFLTMILMRAMAAWKLRPLREHCKPRMMI